MDPIEGGNANDYSGEFGFSLSGIVKSIKNAVSKAVASVLSTARVVVASITSTISKAVTTATRAAVKPAGSPPRPPAVVAAPGQVDEDWLRSAAKVEQAKIPYGHVESQFYYVQAVNSIMDYAPVGALLGSAVGCGAGMIFAGVGCVALGGTLFIAGGVGFGIWGFFDGGIYGRDRFEGVPGRLPGRKDLGF